MSSEVRGCVYAVVFVGGGLSPLTGLVQHYARLGVGRIIVATSGGLAEEQELASRFPVQLVKTRAATYEELIATGEEDIILAHAGAGEMSWVLRAAAGEFQQYPVALGDLIKLLDIHQCNAIAGESVDPVTLEQSGPSRIMLARRRVKIESNRQSTLDGTRIDLVPIGVPEDFRVLASPDATSVRRQPLTEGINVIVSDSRRGCAGGSSATDKPPALSYPRESEILSRLGTIAPNIWQIQNDDSVALTRLLRARRPRRVLEFGPGRSTFLWLYSGCEVDALEYDGQQFEFEKRLFAGFANLRLHRHGRPIEVELPHRHYDLALVDGPPGKLYASHTRLDAVLFALQRSEIVLLHDAKRAGERQTIDHVRSLGYSVGLIDTRAGLGVIRRPDTMLL